MTSSSQRAHIALYGGDYEYTLSLGGVVGGVEIRYRTLPIMDLFARMIRGREFEACEFSLGNYVLMKDAGADWLNAIPVFPNRAFRHATLYVRADSPIFDPADLKRRKLGVPDYSMTAAVWVRGLLNEHYGVHWSDIAWVCDARHERFRPPEGVRFTAVSQDLETLLIEGEIDALIAFNPRDERQPKPERRLRRLFANPEQVERDYYERTGIYPINHCVAVRNDLLERVPNVAAVLFDAYSQAKQRAYERRLGSTLVPWAKRHWTETFDVFGGDPLPYGLTDANRRIVAKLVEYLHEQKFIGRQWPVESLFVEGAGGLNEAGAAT